MEKMLITTGLGGGITALGLLAILVQNYLVRKHDEHGILEKLERLFQKLEDIDKRQLKEIDLFSDSMHEISLTLHQMQAESRMHMQMHSQSLQTAGKSIEKIETKIDRMAS